MFATAGSSGPNYRNVTSETCPVFWSEQCAVNYLKNMSCLCVFLFLFPLSVSLSWSSFLLIKFYIFSLFSLGTICSFIFNVFFFSHWHLKHISQNPTFHIKWRRLFALVRFPSSKHDLSEKLMLHFGLQNFRNFQRQETFKWGLLLYWVIQTAA